MVWYNSTIGIPLDTVSIVLSQYNNTIVTRATTIYGELSSFTGTTLSQELAIEDEAILDDLINYGSLAAYTLANGTDGAIQGGITSIGYPTPYMAIAGFALFTSSSLGNCEEDAIATSQSMCSSCYLDQTSVFVVGGGDFEGLPIGSTYISLTDTFYAPLYTLLPTDYPTEVTDRIGGATDLFELPNSSFSALIASERDLVASLPILASCVYLPVGIGPPAVKIPASALTVTTTATTKENGVYPPVNSPAPASPIGPPIAPQTTIQAEPSQTATDQNPPSQNPPNQTPANQATPNQNPANQATPNQTPANQAPASQATPNQTPANQAPASQAGPYQNPPDQAPASQAGPNQNLPNQAPANQAGSNQNLPDQAPANQAPANQAPANQAVPNQNPPDQAPANQAALNQTPPSQTAPNLASPNHNSPGSPNIYSPSNEQGIDQTQRGSGQKGSSAQGPDSQGSDSAGGGIPGPGSEGLINTQLESSGEAKAAPRLSYAGTTIQPDSSGQYNIPGVGTISPGGPPVTINNNIYSLAPSATALISNGIAAPITFIANSPASSPQPPVLTMGKSAYTADVPSNFVIGGQTLVPGGPEITISGTPVSLAPGATQGIIGSSTFTIPPVGISPAASQGQKPTSTFAGSTYSANSLGQFLVAGQTLTPGAVITVSGTLVSLASSGEFAVIGSSTELLGKSGMTTLPVLTFDGTTFNADALSEFIVDGQTLTPDGSITVSGTLISYPFGGASVVIGTSTEPLSFATIIGADSPIITFDGSTYTADRSSNFIIDGQTLTPGGVIGVSGTPISYAAAGTDVVVASSTEAVGLGGLIMSGLGSGPGGPTNTSVLQFTGNAVSRSEASKGALVVGLALSVFAVA